MARENALSGARLPVFELPEGVKVENMEVELPAQANPLGVAVYLLPEAIWTNGYEREEYHLTFEDHRRLVSQLADRWARVPGILEPDLFANRIVNNCRHGRDQWKSNPWINAPQSFCARLRIMGRYNLQKDAFLPRLVTPEFAARANRKKALGDGAGEDPLAMPGARDFDAGEVLSPEQALWIEERIKKLESESGGDRVSLEILAMAELAVRHQMMKTLVDNEEIKMAGVNQIKQMRTMLGLELKPKDVKASILRGSLEQLAKLFDAVVLSGLWNEWDACLSEEKVKMMLRKSDRLLEDGNPEIDDLHFRVIMGMTIKEARALLKSRGIDPYDKPSERLEEAQKKLLEAARNAV